MCLIKYTFNPTTTSDDQVALYLNPLTADPEPGSPTISTTAGTDSSQMKSVWLPQSQSPEFGSYTGEILMDEIRVGTSWADVLPNDGQAPPTVREPVFTEAFLAGNTLVLNGTNGPPNGGYEMLCSRDVGLPPAGWSGVGIESFTGDGDPIVEYGTVEEAGNYYNYSLQPAEDVPATVTLGAGVGKVTF